MERISRAFLFSDGKFPGDRLLFAAWLGYLLGIVLFDFHHVWAFNEQAGHLILSTSRLGSGSAWSTLGHAFNFMELDGASRARFLSSLVMIWDEKFRLWWIGFLPPHPSLSLTWIFTLGLTPWLYYRAARRLIGEAGAGKALLLFLCSAGFLSGVAMLLRPAKPMAVFMVSLALYWGALLDERVSAQPRSERREYGIFAALVLTVLASFFFDETAWFAVVAIPIYFPDIFRMSRRPRLTAVVWALLFPGFLAMVTFLLPRYLSDFHFWNYAVLSNQALHQPKLVPYLANPVYLVGSQLSWSRHGWPALVWVVAHGLLLFRLSGAPRGSASRLGRLALVPVLFLLFETLILTRQGGIIDTCYYYAALFPLFFSLWLAQAISRSPRKFRLLLTGYLMLVAIHHFENRNQRWRESNAGIKLEPDRARVWQLWRSAQEGPLEPSEKMELRAMTPGIAVEMEMREKYFPRERKQERSRGTKPMRKIPEQTG